jgi:hypothetical protein
VLFDGSNPTTIPDMISEEDFTGLIACALEMLPKMRQLSTTTLAKMYVQLSDKVVVELNPFILQYAIKQRLLDPNPPDDMAFHMQLFRYIYPLQNNVAVLNRGFRSDLRTRISDPDTFHDPSPQREEFMPISDEYRLPAGAYWNVNSMTIEERRKYYEKCKILISTIEPTKQLLEFPLQGPLGKIMYESVLRGSMGKKPLLHQGTLAYEWIARNKKLAQEMLEIAIKERLGSIEDTTTEGGDVPW